MANKERKKRSARQARQAERESQQQATLGQQAQAEDPKKSQKAKAASTKSAKATKAKAAKTGFFARIGTYFSTVNSEMKRVVWPNKKEMLNYSVGVIFMLIFFGLVIWLVDTGVVAGLLGLIGLKG